MNILVTAASKEGATTEVAESIAEVLRERGLDVTVAAPEHVHGVRRYDAFVIGSAVYMGHWLEPATDLLRRSGGRMSGRPVWLFSSGPVGDPNRTLVQKMGADPVELPTLLAQTNAREHRMFAGKLAKEKMSRIRRFSLSILPGFDGDWRNWAEIEQWASTIADELTAGKHSRRAAQETVVAGQPG